MGLPGGVQRGACIAALPGRKVSIVYFYTITMNKNQEPKGVEFRILGRSGALCKEGLAMLAQGGGLGRNYLLSLSVRLNHLFDISFSTFTSRPYPGSGLILDWLASVLVTELYLPIFSFHHTPVCSVLSVLNITPTLPNLYGLDISGKKYFVGN